VQSLHLGVADLSAIPRSGALPTAMKFRWSALLIKIHCWGWSGGCMGARASVIEADLVRKVQALAHGEEVSV
jgi:hypothetical protein